MNIRSLMIIILLLSIALNVRLLEQSINRLSFDLPSGHEGWLEPKAHKVSYNCKTENLNEEQRFDILRIGLFLAKRRREELIRLYYNDQFNFIDKLWSVAGYSPKLTKAEIKETMNAYQENLSNDLVKLELFLLNCLSKKDM